MKEDIIGIIFLLVISILIYVFRVEIFEKKYNTDTELNQHGFGYYTTDYLTECSAECGAIGSQKIIKKCIPHPLTGNGCIDDEGYQTYDDIIEIVPCKSQCYKNSFDRKPDTACNNFLDYNTGEDITNIYSAFTDCVPRNVAFYKETHVCTHKNDTGIEGCIFRCGFDQGLSTNKSNVNRIDNYPIENGKHVCYDTQGRDQLASLTRSYKYDILSTGNVETIQRYTLQKDKVNLIFNYYGIGTAWENFDKITEYAYNLYNFEAYLEYYDIDSQTNTLILKTVNIVTKANGKNFAFNKQSARWHFAVWDNDTPTWESSTVKNNKFGNLTTDPNHERCPSYGVGPYNFLQFAGYAGYDWEKNPDYRAVIDKPNAVNFTLANDILIAKGHPVKIKITQLSYVRFDALYPDRERSGDEVGVYNVKYTDKDLTLVYPLSNIELGINIVTSGTTTHLYIPPVNLGRGNVKYALLQIKEGIELPLDVKNNVSIGVYGKVLDRTKCSPGICTNYNPALDANPNPHTIDVKTADGGTDFFKSYQVVNYYQENVSDSNFIFPDKCYRGNEVVYDLQVFNSPLIIGTDGETRIACKGKQTGTYINLNDGEQLVFYRECRHTERDICGKYVVHTSDKLSKRCLNTEKQGIITSDVCELPEDSSGKKLNGFDKFFRTGLTLSRAYCAFSEGITPEEYDNDKTYKEGDIVFVDYREVALRQYVDVFREFIALKSSQGKTPDINPEYWKPAKCLKQKNMKFSSDGSDIENGEFFYNFSNPTYVRKYLKPKNLDDVYNDNPKNYKDKDYNPYIFDKNTFDEVFNVDEETTHMLSYTHENLQRFYAEGYDNDLVFVATDIKVRPKIFYKDNGKVVSTNYFMYPFERSGSRESGYHHISRIFPPPIEDFNPFQTREGTNSNKIIISHQSTNFLNKTIVINGIYNTPKNTIEVSYGGTIIEPLSLLDFLKLKYFQSSLTDKNDIITDTYNKIRSGNFVFKPLVEDTLIDEDDFVVESGSIFRCLRGGKYKTDIFSPIYNLWKIAMYKGNSDVIKDISKSNTKFIYNNPFSSPDNVKQNSDYSFISDEEYNSLFGSVSKDNVNRFNSINVYRFDASKKFPSGVDVIKNFEYTIYIEKAPFSSIDGDILTDQWLCVGGVEFWATLFYLYNDEINIPLHLRTRLEIDDTEIISDEAIEVSNYAYKNFKEALDDFEFNNEYGKVLQYVSNGMRFVDCLEPCVYFVGQGPSTKTLVDTFPGLANYLFKFLILFKDTTKIVSLYSTPIPIGYNVNSIGFGHEIETSGDAMLYNQICYAFSQNIFTNLSSSCSDIYTYSNEVKFFEHSNSLMLMFLPLTGTSSSIKNNVISFKTRIFATFGPSIMGFLKVNKEFFYYSATDKKNYNILYYSPQNFSIKSHEPREIVNKNVLVSAPVKEMDVFNIELNIQNNQINITDSDGNALYIYESDGAPVELKNCSIKTVYGTEILYTDNNIKSDVIAHRMGKNNAGSCNVFYTLNPILTPYVHHGKELLSTKSEYQTLNKSYSKEILVLDSDKDTYLATVETIDTAPLGVKTLSIIKMPDLILDTLPTSIVNLEINSDINLAQLPSDILPSNFEIIFHYNNNTLPATYNKGVRIKDIQYTYSSIPATTAYVIFEYNVSVKPTYALDLTGLNKNVPVFPASKTTFSTQAINAKGVPPDPLNAYVHNPPFYTPDKNSSFKDIGNIHIDKNSKTENLSRIHIKNNSQIDFRTINSELTNIHSLNLQFFSNEVEPFDARLYTLPAQITTLYLHDWTKTPKFLAYIPPTVTHIEIFGGKADDIISYYKTYVYDTPARAVDKR